MVYLERRDELLLLQERRSCEERSQRSDDSITPPMNGPAADFMGLGASIHMGQGGHVPPIFGLGDIITNVPRNISRVISATFYPCNIFLIS